MKTKFYSTLIAFAALSANAQIKFNPTIDANYFSQTVVMPKSPLKFQLIFIGGVDSVQTVNSAGQPNGAVPAKQWHDFIGFTKDNSGSGDLGWLTVNHEMITKNNMIGDGGGMTAFKIRRDPNTDTIQIVSQTLADGRKGKFFNVDFKNTVGETGMNCGGIQSKDGRIWTAEEWLQSSNQQISGGITDTSDRLISGTVFPYMNGQNLKAFQNLNYMVEIDPKTAKAIRKQYNWGKLGFEGGVILNDNKTVFLGVDATPAYFVKFVADIAGDFNSGKLSVLKTTNPAGQRWLEIPMTSLSDVLTVENRAAALGATMFVRIEWLAVSENNGKIYATETGTDNPSSALLGGFTRGGQYAPHHLARASAIGIANPGNSLYRDYYGRVLEFDTSGSYRVYVEGGPYIEGNPTPKNYPNVHLSNPDGLTTFKVGNKEYLVISEDLNGTSFGRVPAGSINTRCEMFLLDLSIAYPSHNDLMRVSITPTGAEITGCVGTPDGKTLFVNSQHPSTDNPYPYNNSLTYAITGWDKEDLVIANPKTNSINSTFSVYPNPVSRILNISEASDIAIYNQNGQRIAVYRNVSTIDISGFAAGTYLVQNGTGETLKIIVE